MNRNDRCIKSRVFDKNSEILGVLRHQKLTWTRIHMTASKRFPRDGIECIVESAPQTSIAAHGGIRGVEQANEQTK